MGMNDLLNWWLTGIILIVLRLEHTKTHYNKESLLDWFAIVIMGLAWPLTIFLHEDHDKKRL